MRKIILAFILSVSMAFMAHAQVPVRITAVEGTDIYVDGRKVGSDTWSGALNPGTYVMEARKEGLTVSHESRTVLSGVNTRQEFELAVMYGSLDVTSNPTGAAVRIDGAQVGSTPYKTKTLIPGRHSVVVTKDGYQAYDVNIMTIHDNSISINAILKEGETPVTEAAPVQPAPVQQTQAKPVQAQPEVQPQHETQTWTPLQPSQQTPSKSVKTKAEKPVKEKPVKTEPVKEPKQPKVRKEVNDIVFVNALAGYGPMSAELSYGLMAGYVKKVGGYVKVRSNLHSFTNSAEYNYSDASWSDMFGKTRHNITVGPVVRFCNGLYGYAGAGYGQRNVYGYANRAMAKVSDYSYSGVAAEAGLMVRIWHFTLTAGYNTVGFKYGDVDFGIGIAF